MPGPDGRIVCVSSDYPSRIDYPREEPYQLGTIISIAAFEFEGKRFISRNRLDGIPITGAFRRDSNKTLEQVCHYCPWLLEIPQVRARTRHGWIYYFALTPQEWDVLQEAKHNNYQLIFLPDESVPR